jgi:hypothetical protein
MRALLILMLLLTVAFAEDKKEEAPAKLTIATKTVTQLGDDKASVRKKALTILKDRAYTDDKGELMLACLRAYKTTQSLEARLGLQQALEYFTYMSIWSDLYDTEKADRYYADDLELRNDTRIAFRETLTALYRSFDIHTRLLPVSWVEGPQETEEDDDYNDGCYE